MVREFTFPPAGRGFLSRDRICAFTRLVIDEDTARTRIPKYNFLGDNKPVADSLTIIDFRPGGC